MVLTVPQALAQISRYSVDTRDKLNRTTTQGRNAIYNSFGQERRVIVEPNRPGTLYLPITTDLSSFISWSFKLVIRPTIGGSVGNISHFKMILDNIDCTDLFAANLGLPDKEGLFPNSTTGDIYDIINICDRLVSTQRDKILSSGMHTLVIECDQLVEVTMLEFLSYSFLTRGGKPVTEYRLQPLTPGYQPTEYQSPTLLSLNSLRDLETEQLNLEQSLNDVTGSRASQFIQAATINTRLAEIETEKKQLEQMEELQNGRKQIIE